MWDSVLFAARRWTVDLRGRLGSWRLSIVLMVLAALYYVLLAIWAGSAPPHMVRNIAGLAPFWILYALLLLNTGVCLWNRLPTLRRDLSRRPRWRDRPTDWEVVSGPGLDEAGARRMIRGLGYRPTWSEDGRVGGVRRRWSALGTYLFHGAFFLLAMGFAFTMLARQEARIWVAAGERFESRPDQFLSHSAPRLLAAGVPTLEFRVDDIRPEFWGDELLFTTLEARLDLPGDRRATTRINRPLWVAPATFLRLSGFGYAPRYELRAGDGRVLDSAFVKLNVFPPGQRDYFSPPDHPHRFYLQVMPDLGEGGPQPATRSLNLRDPGVILRVTRGRLDLGNAVLRSGETFEYEGLKLGFPEIHYWGEFTIVRDPGAPLLLLAYVAGLAGLLVKVRGRRAEVEWRLEPGGSARLVGWGGRPFAPTRPGDEGD
jgi:hypothetical protein